MLAVAFMDILVGSGGIGASASAVPFLEHPPTTPTLTKLTEQTWENKKE